MIDLIIIGAGGRGREFLECIKEINNKIPTYNVLGFLSDYDDVLNGFECDKKIIGKIKNWIPQGDEKYVLAIDNPLDRQRLAEEFMGRGAQFISLVSPRATIQSYVSIGTGSVILGNSVVLNNTKIGDFCIIAGSTVGDSARIGSYCNTSGFSNITNVTIGDRVYVGSHAVILNKRRIGDDAVVYAGSIVFTNVKAKTKVMGNPAVKVDF